MKKILIIGFGNIGKRHLEGLVGVASDIYIVDIKFIDPREAENEKNKIKSQTTEFKNLYFLAGIGDVNQEQLFDLVIVALSIDQRLIVLNWLRLARYKILLIEKPLFNNNNQYYEQYKSLSGSNSFVNTTVRHQKWLKDVFKLLPIGDEKVVLRVSGNQWGLSCNAIHYLDFFADLLKTPLDLINISPQTTINKVINSKRDGYEEVFGVLAYSFGNKGLLILEDSGGGSNSGITVEVGSIKVDLPWWTGGRALISDKGMKLADIEGRMQYLSEISRKIKILEISEFTNYLKLKDAIVLNQLIIDGIEIGGSDLGIKKIKFT